MDQPARWDIEEGLSAALGSRIMSGYRVRPAPVLDYRCLRGTIIPYILLGQGSHHGEKTSRLPVVVASQLSLYITTENLRECVVGWLVPSSTFVMSFLSASSLGCCMFLQWCLTLVNTGGFWEPGVLTPQSWGWKEQPMHCPA
jgi:hypothetical protein